MRSLAGPAHLYGEKTPAHLRWWSPLTDALPGLKLLWVVRDPRAVVASTLKVPWAVKDPAALAEEWNVDHAELREACRRLPPDRLLTLAYEEVVADPAAARHRIARFLGAATQPHAVHAEQLFVPWETWKSGVAQPITVGRIGAWRHALSRSEAAMVVAVCARGMRELGYIRRREVTLARVRCLGLGLQHRRSRWKVQRNRQRQRRRIARVRLVVADSPKGEVRRR